jgi:selenide,water dikinase
MQQTAQPIFRDIVLVGGGHSHVVVLKNFAMNPIPGVRLTLICRDTHTPYSGMLPGYIAGHYGYDDVHIDLDQQAMFAGARFYRDEVISLDRTNKKVLCKNHPPISYDLLSINIGSTPQVRRVLGAAEFSIPVKPINAFNQRWLALLARVKDHQGEMNIVVVGGGAAGVEMALAMQLRLQKELKKQAKNPQKLHITLLTNSAHILPTHNVRVRRKFEHILKVRKIAVHVQAEVCHLFEGVVSTRDGQKFEADEVLWVTQAGGAAWLKETGLELDDSGFLKVLDTLQTTLDADIFAAGDVATMIHHPREKAGVFAVRQGKPLAENLRLAVADKVLKPFEPQKSWLALISTGDKQAVASKNSWSLSGKIVWRWKDWIDRRFMQQFKELQPMLDKVRIEIPVALTAEESQQAAAAVAMRCGGCGAKVGSSVLSRVLSKLQPIDRNDVLIGLHAPDDAAVVRIPTGMAAVQTVDFFRAFIDDPYIFGQIAANHSLGDIFAMGASAQSATAIATIPYGIEDKVEDTLFQMMSGAIKVLNEVGCALVGGHTGEGQELALGFAINGYIGPDAIMSKAGLQAGDKLILTKPLGTGTLFAAHAQLSAKGRWIDKALDSMCLSNRLAAECLLRHQAHACTDVTGFGLLGHLLEMIQPSGVDVALKLSQLPILPGAEETAAAGILSSLQPANSRLMDAIQDGQKWQNHPRYPLLFDPQTAGGLLASVPPEQANRCVTELCAAGYPESVVIGEVRQQSDSLSPLILED